MNPNIPYTIILQKLNDCKDRQEAIKILSVMNRASLASFAKTLKIHVTNYDRRKDIELKIIEFIVGAKLRTNAINSINLSSY